MYVYIARCEREPNQTSRSCFHSPTIYLLYGLASPTPAPRPCYTTCVRQWAGAAGGELAVKYRG